MNHDTPHYTKVASHEATNGEFDTCLLLYSGGLDTSVMLKWLQEKYNCNVITLTVNIGQTVDDLDAIAEKAKKLGAIETITVDARDRFADELLSLAIKANADYQGGYALCTPLGRIIISQLAVEYAKNTIARSSHTAPLAKATTKFVSRPTSLRSTLNSRFWHQCVSGVWAERKSWRTPRSTISPCHTPRNRPTQPMKTCGVSPAKAAR